MRCCQNTKRMNVKNDDLQHTKNAIFFSPTSFLNFSAQEQTQVWGDFKL